MNLLSGYTLTTFLFGLALLMPFGWVSWQMAFRIEQIEARNRAELHKNMLEAFEEGGGWGLSAEEMKDRTMTEAIAEARFNTGGTSPYIVFKVAGRPLGFVVARRWVGFLGLGATVTLACLLFLSCFIPSLLIQANIILEDGVTKVVPVPIEVIKNAKSQNRE
jgi:hypothetical protein